MTTIDISQVRSLAKRPLEQYGKAFSSPGVTAILDKYGISASPLRVCHFMAQILTETGRLRVLVEDLDYSAKRLMVVWPSRFPTLELARQYEDDPEKLGNFVYANRMGNGDAASGDGFKYRGRGLLQITGKDAYTRFGKQLGIALATNPDLAYDPDHCLEIAAAEWAVSGYHNHFCNELADNDDIHGVTRAINGGLTGIDDRIAQLQRCKAIWLPAPNLASRAGSREDESAALQEPLPAAAAAPAPGFAPAPFDAATATQYGLFVKAAYSMYEADPGNLRPPPSTDFPSGYRLAAWVQMSDFIISPTGPTFYGYVAQGTTDTNQFVLAIRGTQTLEEWWDDALSIFKTPFGSSGQVGLGFDRIYRTLRIIPSGSTAPGETTASRSLQPAGSFAQQVTSLVRQESAAAALASGVSAPASVTVVGHSLGSALATLYTMENAQGDKLKTPTICTFASPRVGDRTFVAAFSALPLTSWRVVNKRDIVPTLPPELFGFSHVGVEALFDSSNTTQPTFACWHSLTTYLSLLDPAILPDPECRLDAAAAMAVPARAAMTRARVSPTALLTDDVIKAAQASQQTWRIPASITIAQWALESGWGRHMPPGSNNPFGIKARAGQPFVEVPTAEFIDGRRVIVRAKFRKFVSLAEAFDAHAELLATSPRYATARTFENDPAKFADALTGVYATDPNYGTQLNSIMSGHHLRQYDRPFDAQPAAAAAEHAPEARDVGAARDGDAVANLIRIASDPAQLQAAQAKAARLLLEYDGEQYPSDGCAITLSVLLQEAGIDVPNTYQAIALGGVMMRRGWTQIAVGDQVAGDLGSTCGPTAHHGTDHIYTVLRAVNSDEMVIADNQEQIPHFRFASGQGKSPTRFFLRAPK